jgi:hypothetical protein
MKAFDFEFDGVSLSSLGYVICNFGNKGLETISNGSKISFNTTPILNGSLHLMTNANYEECLETTFSICKDSCKTDTRDVKPITVEDQSKLMRWLNRKGFHKFKLKQDGYENIYFEGSFNINRHELDGVVYGLELTFVSNRPFALHEPITYEFSVTEDNLTYTIDDISDEIGFIHASMEVVCQADGDLIIENNIETRRTRIDNCVTGETITFNNPIITTTASTHKVQNDFNFNFPRIPNEFNKTENILTFSIPCDVKLTYIPIKKVSV